MRKSISSLCIALAVSIFLSLLAGCQDENSWMDTEKDFAVNLNLSTNEIYIGEIVQAEVGILHPDGTQPDFTEPGADDKIVVRDRVWNSRELEDGRKLTSIDYKLTSFKLGEHRVFKDDIGFLKGNELVGSAEFGDSIISVESTLKGPNPEMRSIAGYEDFPPRFPRWLPVLLIIAVAAAVLGAIVARLWGRRQSKALEPPRPPAHELALAELRGLWQKGWIEENAAEPFYVELSRIVREYIENRFNLRAPEQTTEEFIRDASNSEHLSPGHRELTTDFLRQSDMVKFARYQPAADMMKEAYDSAERLVRETAEMQAEEAKGDAQ